MKKTLSILSLIFIMGSCSLLQPRIPYQLGMSESKFLRQNKNAVISKLSEEEKVYRINNGERFYLLATFKNNALTNLEEIEIKPNWPQQRYIDENNPGNNNLNDGYQKQNPPNQ